MRNYKELVERCKAMRDYNGEVTLEVAQEVFDCVTEAADAIEELIEVIQNHDFLESLIKPHWIPVTEALPESVDDDVLVTDGEGCAVGYWRPDAQAWDSTDFGWLENRSEPPCGIHTVTHWMPLPPSPEAALKGGRDNV